MTWQTATRRRAGSFSSAWYGGRVSLGIGLASAALSTLLAVVLGLTGWMSMPRVVRTLVRQLRQSGYVLSAR